MSHWHISQANSSFPNIISSWDKINQQLYNSHPLLDSRLVLALLQHFGDDTIKLAVYDSEENKTLNILIITQRRTGIWTTFLPSQAQIAPILCSYPQSLPSLFKTLSTHSLSLDILSQDPNFSFQPSSLGYFDKLDHATTMNIEINGIFEDYWQQRSKNLQRNIKRYFNRLNKRNMNVRLVSHVDAINLEKALIRYGNMETQSWKGAKGTAIHKNNQQGLFYLDILNSFAKTGQAEIIELYFNEQLAASRINLLNQNMLIILKTSYDENFSQYAPGRLLLYLLIEQEFSLKRVNKIEFYTNATTDQLSWSTGKRTIQHLTLYPSKYIQNTFKLIRKIKSLLTNK